jgi:hypothetical protein
MYWDYCPRRCSYTKGADSCQPSTMIDISPSENLVELGEVTSATMPVALLSKEPDELAEQGAPEFRTSFDDLDYLMFSILEISSERQVALVHHQNAPTSGTHLCVTQGEKNVVAVILEVAKVLKLSRHDFTWIHPGYEQEFINMQFSQDDQIRPAQNTDDINFATAAALSYAQSVFKIIHASQSKFTSFSEELYDLTGKINEPIKLNDVDATINHIGLISEYKSNITKMLSWMSVEINAINYLVSSLGSKLPYESISSLEYYINTAEESLDTILSSVPSSANILGITLNPDQKQISETKAILSDTCAMFERIKCDINNTAERTLVSDA